MVSLLTSAVVTTTITEITITNNQLPLTLIRKIEILQYYFLLIIPIIPPPYWFLLDDWLSVKMPTIILLTKRTDPTETEQLD